MKRIISIILSVMIMLCQSALFVYAKEYTDTNSDYISSAQYATREQAVARFIEAVGIERFKTDDKFLDKFSDKEKISYAYLDEMAAAVYSGLVSGYEDKTLKPQASITRAEALVILGRALSRTELSEWYDVEFSDTPQWAEKHINRLAAAGIVKGYGDGSLGAKDLLTIDQVTMLCERISRFTGPMGDFYDYVNSAWLESTTLTDGESVQSDIDSLSKTVNSRISDIIFSLYKRHYNNGEEFEDNSKEKKIIAVYSAAANQGYRDKIGLKPIEPLLNGIDAAKNTEDILSVMAELERNGFSTLIKVSLDADIRGSSSYLPAVSGSYTGLEHSLFAEDEADEYAEIYREYIQSLFEISGEDDPKKSAEQAVNICKTLARAATPSAGVNDLSKSVSYYDFDKLSGLYGGADIKKYFESVGLGNTREVIVYDEPLLKAAGSILNQRGIEELKAYLKASVLDLSALYLTTDTFEAYEDYQNKLSGSTVSRIPSDYAVGIVQNLLGWELGSMYIETYFPEGSKPLVEEMTQKIISEYEKLIKDCTRMTPQTRNNAVNKLKKLRINAAYPDNIEDYCREDIILPTIEEGGSLMGYRMMYARAYAEDCKNILESGAKAAKDSWYIYPQTVNAMYDPISNSITIPAGILQPPFFEASAEFEQNLGGIGAVIAHEISHAFDSTGAQFDEDGRLSAWWTEQDRLAFEELCKKVAEEYSDIKVGDLQVDGRLTLNENIADIAGMSCILSLAGSDNPGLDKLFKNYAKTWRIKSTEEYDELMLKTDVHSPNKVRVNRVLSNFAEFEDLYDVVEGDGMYIPDHKKISIWK